MEYRRKRRVSHKPRYQAAYPAYLAVFIVFFGIVYLVGASKAGAWVAENWIAPVLRRNDKAPALTATPARPQTTPETVVIDEVTREAILPEKSFYALQIGVYAEHSNAEAQAAALKKIGAAGYILQDGDRYRVLASAYASKENAQKVAEQLLGEGIESRVHELLRTKKVLKISGRGGELESVVGAVEQADALLEEIYDALIAFDREKQSVADGIAALAPIARRAEDAAQAIAALSAQGGTLAGIDSFYEAVMDGTGALGTMEEASATEFSAALKALYITALLSFT